MIFEKKLADKIHCLHPTPWHKVHSGTALNSVIGYEKGAAIAKKAYAESRPVKEVAKEMTDLSDEELDRLLDPAELTKGGIKK